MGNSARVRKSDWSERCRISKPGSDSRFKESELAQTIPQAHEAIDVRREKYDVLYTLHPERGPRRGRPRLVHMQDS